MTTLRNILLLNGVSSGATGLGLVIFAQPISGLFGVSQLQPFYGTGIFLILFAALVLYESRKNPIEASRVLFITTLDMAWVLASAAIVLLGLFDLSLIGYIAISAIAIWVAAMAYFQSKGIKQVTV